MLYKDVGLNMFKLYLKDKTFEVKLKEVISPRMKGEAAELLQKLQLISGDYVNEMLDLMKDHIDMTELSDESSVMTKFSELIKEGKIDRNKWTDIIKRILNQNKIDTDIIKQKDGIVIRLFKLLVDQKSLVTEIKEEFEKDYDSDFWQEQDFLEMEKEVNSFRAKINLTA